MRYARHLTALAFTVLLGAAGRPAVAADTVLRVFVGGQQRPEVMQPLLDRYAQAHPGIAVTIETGGATSELQQQYLTTLLTSEDSSLDVILTDIVRPAQYAAAGWAEPLDAYLPDKAALLGSFLPAYARAGEVEGSLFALPAFADAMFLYYRKDLLDKYGLAPPASWNELVEGAHKVMKGENNPALQGLSFQGRPIEGTVCTFLVPYWQAGAALTDASGKLTLDRSAAERSLGLWQDLIDDEVTGRNMAEIGTDDTRRDFQAGNVLFAVNWAYAWNHFQADGDSAVRGKVGVARLPVLRDGRDATCIGGWQWVVSAFSAHKAEAADLVRFLAGPQGAKHLALNASNLPARPDLYQDPDVLAANPWFKDALAVLETGRARPTSARYAEVSDIIRSNVNAVFSNVKTVPEAVVEMEARLGRVLR